MRFFKIIFASYAAAVGVGIAEIVIGLIIFGSNETDQFVDNYIIHILFIVTVIVYPFMNRYLK
jgi:hypothetical protein